MASILRLNLLDERLDSCWNDFYRIGQVPRLPSQFAIFVGNEVMTESLPPVASVIDVGCGNGRDAFFFARLGYDVGGLD